jgi:hypothetical protein
MLKALESTPGAQVTRRLLNVFLDLLFRLLFYFRYACFKPENLLIAFASEVGDVILLNHGYVEPMIIDVFTEVQSSGVVEFSGLLMDLIDGVGQELLQVHFGKRAD